MKGLAAAGIDAVVAVGGDGSLTIANALAKKGVRIVGVPKTIDNDLSRTVVTFGFDTAVSFATECIDRLHSTAASHRRVMVVEVMGRYAGWIALNAGVSSTADVILIPEIPYDIKAVSREDPGALRAGQRLRDRGGGRGGQAPRRPPRGDREEGRAGGAAGRRRGPARRRDRARPPGATRASWCWATCCAAARPPPSTA